MSQERNSPEELFRVRRELLDTGRIPTGDPVVREAIRQSWRRSFDEGVDASTLLSPYDDNVNLESRLIRAATPILGRLYEDLAGSPVAIVLTDSNGKVLLRRTGEPSLEARLNRSLLAPGFSYAERHVGTNGIGTALESRSAVSVVGAEHFNEALSSFACVGVPVVDPVTRRRLGVLDLTTWADRADPALMALVRQAAQSVETQLLDIAGEGVRSLLDQYLVASRRRPDRTFAVSADAFLGAGDARLRLAGLGPEELWPLISDALADHDVAAVPVQVRPGEGVVLRMQAVRSPRGELAGGLVEIDEPAPGRSSPPTRSAAPVGFAAMVASWGEEGQPVCVVGEAGVGKKYLVTSVARRFHAGRLMALVKHEDGEATLQSVRTALEEGRPVLVPGAERLPHDVLAALVAAARGLDGWLALTLTLGPDERVVESQAALESVGLPVVVMPPLRSRSQDLRVLVPSIVDRLSKGRVTSVAPGLLRLLERQPWPGNITEIEALLRRMVEQAPGPLLDVDSLPPGFVAAVPRRLTPLEWIQRDAIIEALQASGGDKAEAASALGISRATIYRRIKSFGIDPQHPATSGCGSITS